MQKQFAVTKSNPLHQISSLIRYFNIPLSPDPSHHPTCWDAQRPSLQSRLQAIFLLEGITDSSSSNLGCMKDPTASPNPIQPASNAFSSLVCLDFNSLEKGQFFTPTHRFAVTHTPTGLRINASGCLKYPDDFEDCRPAHSVPLHHRIATANFFSPFWQEIFIFTSCFSSKGFCVTLCPNLYPHASTLRQFDETHTCFLESQHDRYMRTLPPFQRDESHTPNPLLPSCKGWQTSPAIIPLQWDDFLFQLGDHSPGHVSSSTWSSISVKSH